MKPLLGRAVAADTATPGDRMDAEDHVADELPLAGVRVLDLAHMMQGPWAAEMLADLGADVVKVEHVSGGERGRQSGTTTVGGHSAMYLAMNRNKRSLALDLKTERGLAIALDLVTQADVLVQNFRPGVIDRLGLGWERVQEVNPRLVYCSASGYGREADSLPGQDLLAQARTGAMWLTGSASAPPTPSGPFIADIHAAAMLALGAVSALYERHRTGRGRLVEVDLIGSVLHQMTQELVSHHNGTQPTRRPSVPGTPFQQAPYGVYRTHDGWLAISMCPVPDLARALERPDLEQRYPDRQAAFDRREELIGELQQVLREGTTEHWLDLLQPHGIWCSPVNDLDSMAEDPVVGWERRRVRVHHPGIGEVTLVRNPLTLDGHVLPVRAPAPRHGEHSAEVLRELGLSESDVADLVATGVTTDAATTSEDT